MWKPAEGSGKHTHLYGGRGLQDSGSPGLFEPGWDSADDSSLTSGNLACDPQLATWTNAPGQNENLPVNCVNWPLAYAFCIWDGGFLPSENEFEFATAAGGQQRVFPWGNDDPGTSPDYAIFECNYPPGSTTCTGVTNIAPVGTAQLGAGFYGQLDLAGELNEWMLDYNASYTVPCVDCAFLTHASGRERPRRLLREQLVHRNSVLVPQRRLVPDQQFHEQRVPVCEVAPMRAMRRVSQPLLMLTAAFAVCSSVTKAAAEEASSSVTKAAAEEASSSVTKAPAEEAGSSVTKAPAEEAGSSVTKAPAEEAGWLAGWKPGFSGYFRAPLGIAIANRLDPGNAPNHPSGTQLSFAPDHAVDGNFNSFAFTRVQETDWAEVYIHAQRKHVDGAVGWGGYWFQSVGYQRPFAQWMPGFAWIRLDGDFQLPSALRWLGLGFLAGVTPNAAVQVGAFWPTFGYFPAYDTYMMGRIRQIGERIDLKVPVTPNLKVTLTHGLGGNRNGFASVGTVPVVGISNTDTTTALDLLTYANLAVDYRDNVHVGLHWNMSWTTDPGNNAGLPIGATFQDVRDAYLTVTAAELKLNYPRAGLLWLSPTYVQIKNGWALDPLGGVEVLHSQSGLFGANFMGMGDPATVTESTGSGSTFALGGMYANTLGGMMGRGFGTKLPDLRLDVFGLLAMSRRDLPPTSKNTQKELNQFKWGTSLTLQTLTWLALMLRYDQVYDANPQIHDLQLPGNPANDFSMLTARLIVMSHFLSGEMVYIQYTRYFLGDAYRTTDGSALYQDSNPAENVVAVEATMSW